MSDAEDVSLGPPADRQRPKARPAQDAAIGSLRNAINSSMSQADIVDAIISSPVELVRPWEDAELPSGGLYYDWPSGVVKVRAWGAELDKILATPRLAQTGQSLNMMFKNCVEFPAGFGVEDLLVGDQVFLLYYLRGITYGNEYEFLATTPSKKKVNYTVDLNELQHTIKHGDPSLGDEPFRVDLPYLSEQAGQSVYVSLRFLRVRDQKSITRQQADWRRVMPSARVKVGDDVEDDMSVDDSQYDELDDTVTRNLAHMIVNVMGSVTDRFKIQQFVDKMHSSDIATIRTWIRDHTPGIEPIVTLTDPLTGEEFKVALPFTESFFRRSKPRVVRE